MNSNHVIAKKEKEKTNRQHVNKKDLYTSMVSFQADINGDNQWKLMTKALQ